MVIHDQKSNEVLPNHLFILLSILNHIIPFTYSRRIKVRVKRSTPSSWRANRYRPQWSSQQRHCRIWEAGREDSFCWMICSICLISTWASSSSPMSSSQARRPHRQLTWRSLKRSLQGDLGSWALGMRRMLEAVKSVQVEGKENDCLLIGSTVHQELGIGKWLIEISTAELGITSHNKLW